VSKKRGNGKGIERNGAETEGEKRGPFSWRQDLSFLGGEASLSNASLVKQL
jgi:hypothetical protein